MLIVLLVSALFQNLRVRRDAYIAATEYSKITDLSPFFNCSISSTDSKSWLTLLPEAREVDSDVDVVTGVTVVVGAVEAAVVAERTRRRSGE